MRTVLATDHGKALYRKRQVMVEPVFAQTKHNRRIASFQRRGRAAARSEWRLIAATHNLMKLHQTPPTTGLRRHPGRTRRLALRSPARFPDTAGAKTALPEPYRAGIGKGPGSLGPLSDTHDELRDSR
jgi:hypothetical protein